MPLGRKPAFLTGPLIIQFFNQAGHAGWAWIIPQQFTLHAPFKESHAEEGLCNPQSAVILLLHFLPASTRPSEKVEGGGLDHSPAFPCQTTKKNE